MQYFDHGEFLVCFCGVIAGQDALRWDGFSRMFGYFMLFGAVYASGS